MKAIAIYILFCLAAFFLTYLTVDSVLKYIFIDIMHECIVDEYGADCFGPVTKSAMIAGLSSLIVVLISIYLIVRKRFIK